MVSFALYSGARGGAGCYFSRRNILETWARREILSRDVLSRFCRVYALPSLPFLPRDGYFVLTFANKSFENGKTKRNITSCAGMTRHARRGFFVTNCDIFSVSSMFKCVTQAKQMTSLLLLNHFYPAMSYRRVREERKATNSCIRFGRSLWSANQFKSRAKKAYHSPVCKG